MATNKYLNEFKRFSGIIQESDDLGVVQNIIPGLENAESMCAEAVQELQEVIERLKKLQNTMQNEMNNIHLPAESQWLAGKLRASLRGILSSESPIRRALTELDRF